MSKKEYKEVAAILHSMKEAATSEGKLPNGKYTQGYVEGYSEGAKNVALELALMFKRDNPRFDASKFFDAAGFPELTATRQGLN